MNKYKHSDFQQIPTRVFKKQQQRQPMFGKTCFIVLIDWQIQLWKVLRNLLGNPKGFQKISVFLSLELWPIIGRLFANYRQTI